MVRVNRGNALLSLAIEWRRWIGLKIERGGGCCGGGRPLILVRRHNNTDTAPCRQLEKRKPRADRRRRAAVMHAITRINELWPYLWLYQPTATRRSSAPSSFSNPPPHTLILFLCGCFLRDCSRIPNRTANATIPWSTRSPTERRRARWKSNLAPLLRGNTLCLHGTMFSLEWGFFRKSSALYEFLQESIATSYRSSRLEITFVSIVPETLGSSDLRRNVSRENFFSAKFLIVLSNLHERKRRERNERKIKQDRVPLRTPGLVS